MFNICFHKWSKWGDPVVGYDCVVQLKMCSKCAKVVTRHIGDVVPRQRNVKESPDASD